ncbi:hypothetical protein [Nocardia barduliensis]|uniref:hypothetical protein n=1 Tax=Nocardia barduliensis TaxID=2736643 RepID=UPI00157477D0|nr:hypothetical protein [Nocardia barduliensis]
MFSATTSTAPRRILVRAVVAGVIAAAPLTISAIPASADVVGTEINHDSRDDHPGFHGIDRGNDWPGDHDRGRGNDPLWRLFHNLIPRGVFGSS